MGITSALNALQGSTGYGSSSSYNSTNNTGQWASRNSSLQAATANAVKQKNWEDTAAYNAAEALKNRQFQEYMSNTAYQRAMADMQLAGLNPILAANQGGASTPGGSTASVGLFNAAQGQSFTDNEGWSSSSYATSNNIADLANLVTNSAKNVIGTQIGSQVKNAATDMLNQTTGTAKKLFTATKNAITSAYKYVTGR